MSVILHQFAAELAASRADDLRKAADRHRAIRRAAGERESERPFTGLSRPTLVSRSAHPAR